MSTFYELTYVVDPVSDDLVDSLYEAGLDVNVSGHDGLTFLATTVVADDPVDGAFEFAQALQSFGIKVLRLDLNLVNRAAIADICGVTRQAVTPWVNTPGLVNRFPKPYTAVKGPLWVWSEVNDWLRRSRKDFFEDSCYPTPTQIEEFNVRWTRTTTQVNLGVPQVWDTVQPQSVEVSDWTIHRETMEVKYD